MLTPPIGARLRGKKRVLVAGCGGGYDVFGAVPLAVELVAAGHEVELASLSFTQLSGLDGARQDAEHPHLYEVSADSATRDRYCPEAWLARFLSDRLGAGRSIWSFDVTGVAPLRAAYRALVDRLALDAIVLVDGGIDALLRGDETSLGTPAEDLASIAAVRALERPSYLACIGFGAETRDGIAHEQAFARIAELTREGGFLGSSALVRGTNAADTYFAAVDFTFANQAETKRSHIHELVRASVRGEYGERAKYVWLSPLLSTFFFFDLAVVARTHLFLDQLDRTETIWEVNAIIEAIRHETSVRERTTIPI